MFDGATVLADLTREAFYHIEQRPQPGLDGNRFSSDTAKGLLEARGVGAQTKLSDDRRLIVDGAALTRAVAQIDSDGAHTIPPRPQRFTSLRSFSADRLRHGQSPFLCLEHVDRCSAF